MASSAHRDPRRESFARGSAAMVVSWRHTCPFSRHRWRRTATSSVVGRRPRRLVGQASGHGVTCYAFAPAIPAPAVGPDDPAHEDSAVRLESLPDHGQAETVESSEGGRIRPVEVGRRGSVRHVEVFWMRRVGAFILRGPRRLSGDRRADPTYTLIWEEPLHRPQSARGRRIQTPTTPSIVKSRLSPCWNEWTSLLEHVDNDRHRAIHAG